MTRTGFLGLSVAILAGTASAAPAGALEGGAASPYVVWKNGPSTDPAFFPVAVWLQAPRNSDRKEVAGRLDYVPKGVDRLREWTGGRKAGWNCIECTPYDGPSRKPTPRDVKADRR